VLYRWTGSAAAYFAAAAALNLIAAAAWLAMRPPEVSAARNRDIIAR
jgi:hypothetical protein